MVFQGWVLTKSVLNDKTVGAFREGKMLQMMSCQHR